MSGKKRSKKPNEQIKPRTISRAPPPVPTIRGGGYDPLRSKRPEWSLWNKMPVLSITECVFLLINVEPKTYLSDAAKQRYDRLSRLAQSYQAIGELPSDYDDIAPKKFIEWAESISEAVPMAWQPGVTVVENAESAESSIHVDRYNEAVDAAIMSLKDGERLHQISALVPVLFLKKDKFTACCEKKISDDSLYRSIRKGGGNPLCDLRYLDALQEVGK